jgi:hypothetical protein
MFDRTAIERISRLIGPYVRVTPVAEVSGADFGLAVKDVPTRVEVDRLSDPANPPYPGQFVPHVEVGRQFLQFLQAADAPPVTIEGPLYSVHRRLRHRKRDNVTVLTESSRVEAAAVMCPASLRDPDSHARLSRGTDRRQLG